MSSIFAGKFFWVAFARFWVYWRKSLNRNVRNFGRILRWDTAYIEIKSIFYVLLVQFIHHQLYKQKEKQSYITSPDHYMYSASLFCHHNKREVGGGCQVGALLSNCTPDKYIHCKYNVHKKLQMVSTITIQYYCISYILSVHLVSM